MSTPEEKTAKRNVRPLRQLAPFLRPYRSIMVAAGIALVAAASATLALPLAFRQVVDEGFASTLASNAGTVFPLLLGVGLALAAATACRYYFVTWLGERVVADLRNAVYSHVVQMNPTFFEVTRTGEVLSRLTTDTTLIQSVIGSSVSVALRNVLLFFGGLVLLVLTAPGLVLAMLLLIPLVLVPVLGMGRRVRGLSRQSQDRIGDMSAMANESLTAASVVQAFNNQSFEISRFGVSVAESLETALRRTRMRAVLTAVAIVLVFAALSAVLWLGARAMQADELTAGQFVQFLLYAFMVGASMGALSEVWGELQRAAGATERLMELLQVEPEIKAPEQPVAMPVPAQGRVSFDSVCFSYPSRPGELALDEFSLEVAQGETVALVGASGAGKSTVFQLLLRFYDPKSGEVSIDGVGLHNATPDDVRSRIGIVPQHTVIFGSSVLENIRYGRADATDQEVMDAAKFAHADEFIKRLPDGYATHVGERGVRLSGGQQQRIAIARAVLKHPPIMLLDEATSALDAESERHVQQAFEELMATQTTLVIAHRLATVQKADRIIVMDGGRIVAQGTHAQLMQEDGVYRRLADLQFRTDHGE